MNIKEFIQIIRVRPEMFVGSKKMEYIYHYINGFLYSNIVGNRADAEDLIFKEQFSEWVKKNIENAFNLDLQKCRNYVFYIEQVSNSEENKVEIFFTLCDEFFDDVL